MSKNKDNDHNDLSKPDDLSKSEDLVEQANEKSQDEQSASDKQPVFDAKPIPRMEAPKSAKKSSFLIIILIILVMILGSAVGWMAYEQYQAKQNWLASQNEFKQQLNDYAKKIEETRKEAKLSQTISKSNQSAIQQQSSYNQQFNQGLLATQEKVKKLSGRRQQDWMLAEVEYLINLASLKMSLDKDKISSLTLLKAADEKILKIADNSLLSLRQTIAEDITQLELVELVDISGIASELNAISLQIPELSLIASEFKPEEVKRLEKENSEFSWSKIYRDFLDDFVTIKDHNEPIKPLMTSDERANLNANIQLALQQSQIALLRNDEALYKLKINNTIDWVGEFFKHNQTSEVILDKLEKLSDQKINLEFPSELKSKKKIQVINHERLYQWLEKDAKSKNHNDSSSDKEKQL